MCVNIENMTGAKLLVVGMARSGLAVCKLLSAYGAQLIANDSKPAEELPGVTDALSALPHVRVELGRPALPFVDEVDAIVISPGVPADAPFVRYALERRKPVLGELELGFLFTDAPVVAVTGTNGKTTTTSLIHMMFQRAGRQVHLVGNIGEPICAHVDQIRNDDTVVAEVSSFQLETTHTFHPRISAVLNIGPDHLERHHTMDAYIALKERIFENQRGDDALVLNWDDPVTRAMAHKARCRVLFFSRSEEVQNGCFVRDGRIVYRLDGHESVMGRVEEVRVPGTHNLENALAAATCALYMGVQPVAVRHTLAAFQGVEHRLELVQDIGGVRFINDSKGTNPDSTIKAVQAMQKPTVLIAGGYDKGIPFDELMQIVRDSRVFALVTLGATAQAITRSAEQHGITDITQADTLQQAVRLAYEKARPGNTVLFSPACASFDMFVDYEQRGRLFKQYVNDLARDSEHS